ncbi:hypothetical protein CUMW_175790, partial [Citrus unshiu]
MKDRYITTRYPLSPAPSGNHFGLTEAADELIPTHNRCCFHSHIDVGQNPLHNRTLYLGQLVGSFGAYKAHN